MRLVSTILVIAGLAALLGGGTRCNTALAQALEAGGGASVATAPGRRVNVRSLPEIEPGNVVAVVLGGDLLRVLEATPRDGFTWYRIETLPGRDPAVTGWIRGDLLNPAALAADLAADLAQPEQPLPEQPLPDHRADTVNGTTAPPGGDAAVVPYAERSDWSRDILGLHPAIAGCVGVNSAPPVTVLRATARNRGLTEVIMSDSAGRRWDCVISSDGGTPIRYDPLSGAIDISERHADAPTFEIGEARPERDATCYRFERVVQPADGTTLGWLLHRTCP